MYYVYLNESGVPTIYDEKQPNKILLYSSPLYRYVEIKTEQYCDMFHETKQFQAQVFQ